MLQTYATLVIVYQQGHRKTEEHFVVLLIARVQILFIVWSVQCVASNTLASLSSPSTNACMDTLVTQQTSNFFVCDSTSDSLTTISKILVIEQNYLWNDFQGENRERFCFKELRVLHPDGINRKQQVFMYFFFHSFYSQRIFYYCHKDQDLCSPPLINDLTVRI